MLTFIARVARDVWCRLAGHHLTIAFPNGTAGHLDVHPRYRRCSRCGLLDWS